MARASVMLTASAEADLEEIARYTAKEWGKKQALRYAALLDGCFERIAKGVDVSRPALPGQEAVRVCRAEHHYVFYLRKGGELPIVLAVLHERMDLLQRLRDRLPG